ncbi:MAG: STM3941 family protein [Verrucomicrobiales bacterium]
MGRIPWSEIQGAYIRTISGNDFICLEVRCPEQYISEAKGIKQALANVNRALGFTPVSLNLSGVAVDTADVLEFIIKRIEIPTEETANASAPSPSLAAEDH